MKKEEIEKKNEGRTDKGRKKREKNEEEKETIFIRK